MHVLYIFCCAAHPRELHSFPTRRSSDLGGRRERSSSRWPEASIPNRRAIVFVSMSPKRDAKTPKGFTDKYYRATIGNRRSEEHTSELQSHSDLVCRLLLEKNKQLPAGDS